MLKYMQKYDFPPPSETTSTKMCKTLLDKDQLDCRDKWHIPYPR